jgi:dethiobiotin synthetase
MAKNAVFIAATGQNVGKTTICLGILAALKKRFNQVGFIKPVGQQHVTTENGTIVDKDAILFHEFFKLPLPYSDMSPVILPSNFTRDFLDGKISSQAIEQRICSAFERIENQSNYTVVEGTGHVGVGSIIHMNNAQVAARLGLDMILIGSGGLGSTYDELAQNIAICRANGVQVKGIILNKVLDEKRDMILEYFPKALKSWGIPLIGCVPYNRFLHTPTIKDFELLFDTTLIAGEQHRYRHFNRRRLVAGSLDSYKYDMLPNELIITPACREDIILANLDMHHKMMQEQETDFEGGIILTSRKPPSDSLIAKIKASNVPVLYAPLCSYDAMKMITHYTAKIRKEDISKVEQAIALVEENIDFDALCDNCYTRSSL